MLVPPNSLIALKTNNDIILLIALSEGQERAFDLIFACYYKLIFAFLYKQCHSVEDAKDMAQEVFTKLWLHRHAIAPNSSLKSYLFAIAKNTFIDFIRKRINKQVFESITDSNQLNMIQEIDLDADISTEALALLHRAAQNMPPKRMEVYQLRWIEGLSRKDIAQRMGITVVTVDIHIRKALEYLRSRVL